jgi:hypothetical protein
MATPIKSKAEAAEAALNPNPEIIARMETLQGERSKHQIKKEVFLTLVQERAKDGYFNRGILPGPEVLVEQLSHFAGVAEIAATLFFKGDETPE